MSSVVVVRFHQGKMEDASEFLPSEEQAVVSSVFPNLPRPASESDFARLIRLACHQIDMRLLIRFLKVILIYKRLSLEICIQVDRRENFRCEVCTSAFMLGPFCADLLRLGKYHCSSCGMRYDFFTNCHFSWQSETRMAIYGSLRKRLFRQMFECRLQYDLVGTWVMSSSRFLKLL